MLKHIPNMLTVFRIILTPFFVYCVLKSNLQLCAVILFFIASVTDWYDGYLARKYGLSSDWGRFLDPLADKILVLSALFSFAYLGLIQFWMVVVIVLRDVLVTSLRSYALHQGKPIVTNLFAKLKTAFQMLMIGLILLFIALQSLLINFAVDFRDYVTNTVNLFTTYNVIYGGMLIVTLFTAISGLIYLYQNWDAVRKMTTFSFFKSS
jgi:CDP-diacylglycerol---glycerol-3-phosphate 3-phosphatidyltransferase